MHTHTLCLTGWLDFSWYKKREKNARKDHKIYQIVLNYSFLPSIVLNGHQIHQHFTFQATPK
jgi:hypothetical protein